MEVAAENGVVQADASFCIAFALGWETASLYRGTSFDAGHGRSRVDALPDLTSFTPGERASLAIDLIEANLKKLEERLSVVGPIDSTLIGEVRGRLDDHEQLQPAVRDLHFEVLCALTAANLRLGRAYGLGHALADTCLMPTDRASFDEAFGERLIAVKDWLADLSSSFPPHSSRATVLSLRAWESWAANPCIDGESLSWDVHGASVREALRRQGELWRDLLARDKDGQDMLDTSHYLSAANSLIRTMATTVWRFLRPFRILLYLGGLALLIGLALVLFFPATATKAVGVILSALGAAGITTVGLRTRLGQVATQLQTRLWGVELDLAIGEAVLLGPEGWDASVANIAVPASGPAPKIGINAIVLQDFRQAVAAGQFEELSDLLTPDVEFGLGNGDTVRGRTAVATWVLGPDTAPRFAAEPGEVKALGTGVLITRGSNDGGTEAWRVQERKVRRWSTFANEDDVRTAVRDGSGGW
jgi:hypothetical protein